MAGNRWDFFVGEVRRKNEEIATQRANATKSELFVGFQPA